MVKKDIRYFDTMKQKRVLEVKILGTKNSENSFF
jgi:hypothetical protein